MRALHVLPIFTLALVVPALTARAAEPAGPTAVPPPAERSPVEPTAKESLKPMTLSDTQVKGFLDAADEFAALGNEDGELAELGNEGAAKLTADILGKHGFKDPGEFQQVAYNVALAYGVLEQGGTQALQKQFEESKAEREKALAQLREQMPPEQVQQLEEQLQQMEEMVGMMQDVPDGNVELVRKYRDRMEKLQRQ